MMIGNSKPDTNIFFLGILHVNNKWKKKTFKCIEKHLLNSANTNTSIFICSRTRTWNLLCSLVSWSLIFRKIPYHKNIFESVSNTFNDQFLWFKIETNKSTKELISWNCTGCCLKCWANGVVSADIWWQILITHCTSINQDTFISTLDTIHSNDD